MSDGQWIESGTLDQWHDRDMAQRDRIRELEAERDGLRDALDDARDACSSRADLMDDMGLEVECCAGTARCCVDDIEQIIAALHDDTDTGG